MTRLPNVINLKDADGAEIKSYALTSGTSVYSEPLQTRYMIGWQALNITDVGGSDDIDINYEVSLDGKTWFTPQSTNGTSLTSLGSIVVALTADAWIDLSTRMVYAPWTRFQFDPDANSTITAQYCHQEE